MGRPLKACLMALAVAVRAVAAIGSPVLDDDALARGFTDKLGRLVDAGGVIEAEAAKEQLSAAHGATATLPEAAEDRRIVPAGPLYDAVLPAVVAVGSVFKCDRCSRWHLGGLASGWIVSPDGLVVTNHHVLQRDAGHRFGVMTSDGEVYAVTSVVASDPEGDAAVLRIDGRGREFACLAIGDAPACGTPVSVISHPRGRFYCLTEGVVSRYHRQRRRDRDDGATAGPPAVWMSVTADYAVGSSGGPVFDGAGRVVGMVSRTATVLPRQRPAGPVDAESPPDSPHPQPPQPQPQPPPQMIFKDCVSAETLRAILGVDARGPAPPPGS